MVCMPAEGYGLFCMTAHGSSSEDPDGPVVHQLGGDVGQGATVEDCVEIVVDKFWALAEIIIGVEYGRVVIVRHGAVQ